MDRHETVILLPAHIKVLNDLLEKHGDEHFSIMQEHLMSGSDYAGHVMISIGFPAEETVHLDRQGNVVAKEAGVDAA
jgi:hypothetical protein